MPSEQGDLAALILAGGLSSRMGREKATLSIESKQLIGWAYEAANGFADHVYVSVHDGNGIDHLKPALPPETTYILDLYDNPRSVLLALLSSFRQMQEEHIAVLPVDSPFMNPNVMMRMVSSCREYDSVIPLWPDGKLEAIQFGPRTFRIPEDAIAKFRNQNGYSISAADRKANG